MGISVIAITQDVMPMYGRQLMDKYFAGVNGALLNGLTLNL